MLMIPFKLLTDEPMWETNAGKQIYSAIDLNLDTQINNPDKDDVWLPNIGAFARIPSSIPFSCGGLLLDARDGQAYNTVQIGTQCWMAESMNIGVMTSHNSPMANNGVIEKYCYENDVIKCQEWGGLYQWDEAMQYSTNEGSQGICPASWHIPSETEWDILDDFFVHHSVAGGKMKESGTLTLGLSQQRGNQHKWLYRIASGYIAYSEPTPDNSLWTHNYIWSSTQSGVSTRVDVLLCLD